MSNLRLQERLQPALLDRIIDRDTEISVESLDNRALSTRQLRESVERDLVWLLSTVHLEATRSLEDYPEVQRSVLNYGVSELVGNLASSVSGKVLEKEIRNIIKLYEPRLLSRSLKVEVTVSDSQMSRNALSIQLQGQIWSKPMPVELYLKTELDLETGSVNYSRG